mgnify:CR=1 FL=1
MFQFRTIHLLLWLFLLPLLAQPVLGADATSFDPTKVAVEAKSSGGVPVGTIISWPVATNPEDMDNWLECNGQSISPSVYPELFAVLGNSVPDLRGLFLRGYGAQTSSHYGSVVHQSGELGMIQGDAIRNITGSSGDSPRSGVYYYGALAGGAGGARKFAGEGLRGRSAINFDASRVVPTAPENRPVNTAVRYLIRARP